jgi:glycosyltransferase involved in cell wall biosynthesis
VKPLPTDALSSHSGSGRIADAWVHVQCAYTSLERLRESGLLAREVPFFARIGPRFGTIVVVSYGRSDAELARGLVPPGFAGRLVCIDNASGLEPARFQAGVPGRVAEILGREGAGSALVFMDQHYGGEVGVACVRALREGGVRTGLVARGGYHWSRFEAHDFGAESARAARAGALEGELCRAADVIVGSTRRMLDDLSWRHGVPIDRFRLIPNFVSGDLRPGAFETREAGAVLSVGRLETQKRHELLIRAMVRVGAARPGARLTIVGEGSRREELVGLIERLGAPVEIRPRVDHHELRGMMRRCRVYAQVSSLEGHPKTIIEALAAGAPTLVTRAPGVDDEVRPGVTGLVCDGTPESVAEGLERLLGDDGLSARLGMAAAGDVASRLSLEAVVPLHERAMLDAMASAGAGLVGAPACVRFDQTLLNAAPGEAAGEFAGAIAAYAKRLPAEDRAGFGDALLARLSAVAVGQR